MYKTHSSLTCCNRAVCKSFVQKSFNKKKAYNLSCTVNCIINHVYGYNGHDELILKRVNYSNRKVCVASNGSFQ